MTGETPETLFFAYDFFFFLYLFIMGIRRSYSYLPGIKKSKLVWIEKIKSS